jgi:hypothetical protein
MKKDWEVLKEHPKKKIEPLKKSRLSSRRVGEGVKRSISLMSKRLV